MSGPRVWPERNSPITDDGILRVELAEFRRGVVSGALPRQRRSTLPKTIPIGGHVERHFECHCKKKTREQRLKDEKDGHGR